LLDEYHLGLGRGLATRPRPILIITNGP